MSTDLQAIGRRVAELREIAGISPESVARDLGISATLYAQYERGEQDIPVGVLIQVADLFGVELTALLTGDEPRLHEYSLTRRGRGVRVERRKDYDYEAIAYNFANKKCEPFLVTVAANAPEPTRNSHPGQEFDYMLEGRMRVFIGSHEVVLEVGDCVYYDATRPHAMQALDGQPARFLAVIV